jgi:dTDP-4-amino-4,6-dideoxygalactose transaminase
MKMKIPFNKPFIVGKELHNISQAVFEGHLAGDGAFTKKCHAWLEERFGAKKVLLTHSCTAALEMSAILCDLEPGDEVIMPSYTFVSTANAFALRGARIRFVDIREDTLNIDETLIEDAITPRTKAIVTVHYAGVAAEMDTILDIAKRHDLLVVEDAAQGVNATYKDRYLGTIGDLGAYSFHETKNFISGEGGALLVNNDRFVERAQIIREKGTNRSEFYRGQVDKYTWVDIGSSYLPSEIVAAFLYAQLEEADTITAARWEVFRRYEELLQPLAEKGQLRIPYCPSQCRHNAHMFYVILPTQELRDGLIAYLKEKGILSVFHYVPLHTSPMGQRVGYSDGALPVTGDLSSRLVRLPCYFELTRDEQDEVVEHITEYFMLNESQTRA